MSAYSERKNFLHQEIIGYHDLEGVSNRVEKEIYVNCAINVAKTLRSMSELAPIKCEYYSITRIIKLAEWLIKHIKEEKQKIAKLIFRNIKQNKKEETFIKNLQFLYDLAIKYPKNEEEDEIKLNNEINLKNENNSMTLAEYVFRYFRYFNNNNPVTLLDSKAFQYKELLSDETFVIIPSNKTSLITAYCQSGKTFLVIPVALIYLALGMTPVMVVLDKSQAKQLMRRLRTYCKDLKNHLRELGHFTEDELNVFNDSFLYYDSRVKKSEDDDSLGLALTGEKPRIIIAIKHYQHIERINEMVNEFSNIVLIADEAQVSCCYKNTDSDTYHDPSVKYDNEFVKLREASNKYIAVSATVQDVIMVDKTLYSDNIVYIPPNDYYTGIANWQFKHIDKEENAVVRILDELSTEKPIVRYDRRHNVTNEHPIIVLIKTERKKEDHLSLMKFFISGRLSHTITEGDWCVIVEHGECFYLYHSSLVDETVVIEEKESIIKKIDDDISAHYFSSNQIDISDVFQYLAYEGVKRFSRIALISYDMCKEAISFTSHYDKPQNYHLTHGIFQLGPKTSIATATQTMNRLSGNHGDNIRPVIYTTEKTKKDVLNGFAIHDDQVKELISISQIGNVCISSEYLESYPIFKNRHSSNYNKVKGIEKNLIENPNKSDEEKILEKPELDCINFLCKINDEYEDEKKKNIELYGEGYYKEKGESDGESDDDENEGGIIIIKRNDLKTEKQIALFNSVFKELSKNKNKWIAKTQVLEQSGSQNQSWHWHKYGKHTDDENTKEGILLSKKNNRWFFRLN